VASGEGRLDDLLLPRLIGSRKPLLDSAHQVPKAFDVLVYFEIAGDIVLGERQADEVFCEKVTLEGIDPTQAVPPYTTYRSGRSDLETIVGDHEPAPRVLGSGWPQRAENLS
jgi:hypothetical protein